VQANATQVMANTAPQTRTKRGRAEPKRANARARLPRIEFESAMPASFQRMPDATKGPTYRGDA